MGSQKFFPGNKMYRPNVRYRQQAFTLIELLVVISVILIAASIVVVTGRGGSGAALSSSTRIVNSIVQGARGQAILQNAPARLIIYAEEDNEDPDKFLRFFGIVYWGTDQNENEGWIAATQGTYLPRGIYFDPDLSASAGSSTWSANTMNLDFPVRSAQGPDSDSDSETFFYYEFEANGRAELANAWLVIRAGFLDQNNEINFDRDEDAMLKAALIIRQSGTATIVTDPSEVR
jgi:prepilin-type N-terminal cleavage/methylation domain-containing protein